MSPAAINFTMQTATQYFSQMVAETSSRVVLSYSCEDQSVPHDSSYGCKLDIDSYLDKLL